MNVQTPRVNRAVAVSSKTNNKRNRSKRTKPVIQHNEFSAHLRYEIKFGNVYPYPRIHNRSIGNIFYLNHESKIAVVIGYFRQNELVGNRNVRIDDFMKIILNYLNNNSKVINSHNLSKQYE